MAVRAKARSSALYEEDLYAWSEAQAGLLRRRRFAELDLEHVAEEIEDVGGSLYHEVRPRIRSIMEHLLKLERSAATEPRAGWGRTIRRERADLAKDLTPSLRPRVEHGLARFYEPHGSKPRRRSAPTAKTRPPTPSRRPCPTRSTRSPATACRIDLGSKPGKVPDASSLTTFAHRPQFKLVDSPVARLVGSDKEPHQRGGRSTC